MSTPLVILCKLYAHASLGVGRFFFKLDAITLTVSSHDVFRSAISLRIGM